MKDLQLLDGFMLRVAWLFAAAARDEYHRL
jgi:hypothetical protein